jgi:hypothetical protein
VSTTPKLPAFWGWPLETLRYSAYAAIPVLHTLAEPLKSQVIHAFVLSLRLVWLVAIPLSAFGMLANFFCKEIPMHKHVDEKWGLNESIPAEKDQEMGRLPAPILKPSSLMQPVENAPVVGMAYWSRSID